MSLEQDIITALAIDMGPSAPSFLKRQCQYHLNKEPASLVKSDVTELSKWVFVGSRLILDEATAERLKNRILAIVS